MKGGKGKGKGKGKVEKGSAKGRKVLGEISGNEEVGSAHISDSTVDPVTSLSGIAKIDLGSDTHVGAGVRDTSAVIDSTFEHYDLVPVHQNFQIDPLLLDSHIQHTQHAPAAGFSASFFDNPDHPFFPSQFDHHPGFHPNVFNPVLDFGIYANKQRLSPDAASPPPPNALAPAPVPEEPAKPQITTSPKRRKRRQHRARAARHAAALAVPKNQDEAEQHDAAEPDSSDELENQGYDLFTMSWPSITGSVAGPPRAASQTPNAGIGGLGGHLKHHLHLDGYLPAPQSNPAFTAQHTDRPLWQPPAAGTPRPSIRQEPSQSHAPQSTSSASGPYEYPLLFDDQLSRSMQPPPPLPPRSRCGRGLASPGDSSSAVLPPSILSGASGCKSFVIESLQPGIGYRYASRDACFDGTYAGSETDHEMGNSQR